MVVRPNFTYYTDCDKTLLLCLLLQFLSLKRSMMEENTDSQP